MPMENILIGDIVKVLEGSVSITDCSDKENTCRVCNRTGECISQWIWTETSEVMYKKLNSFNLDNLVKDSDK